MKFAHKLPKPNRVAAFDFNDVCWPFPDVESARETAKAVGAPGFWRLKALKSVECEA